eukprot:CFRG4211T1
MKVTRHKQARKTLAFYKARYGLHEPFQVLVDATFCQASLQTKIYIKDQLATYFGGTISLFTSPCIVEEVRKLGSEFSGAHLINRKFEYRRCNHKIGVKNARDCVLDIVGTDNRFRLIVATQDLALREKLRKIPGVPIVYINYNAPILEAPSPASKGQALEETKRKNEMRDTEKEFLATIIPEPELPEEVAPKKRKKKGVNSLAKLKPLAERLADEKERKRKKNLKKALKRRVKENAEVSESANANEDAGLGVSSDAKEGVNKSASASTDADADEGASESVHQSDLKSAEECITNNALDNAPLTTHTVIQTGTSESTSTSIETNLAEGRKRRRPAKRRGGKKAKVVVDTDSNTNV